MHSLLRMKLTTTKKPWHVEEYLIDGAGRIEGAVAGGIVAGDVLYR